MGTVRLELEAIDVDDEEEERASLYMLQELVSHAQVVAGALYQSWQVRQCHPPQVGEVAGCDVWLYGGEGVARNLGAGAGYRLEQCALTSVGKTYKADICDELEVQLDTPPLPLDAAVVRVSGPPRPPPRHQDGVVVLHEISEQLAAISQHRHPDRRPDDHVFSILSHTFEFPKIVIVRQIKGA